MPGIVIGLDIGAHAVKAAVLKGTLRGYEVEDFLTLPLDSVGAAPVGPSPAAEAADDADGDEEAPAEGGPPSLSLAKVDEPPVDDRVGQAVEQILESIGHDNATVVAAVPSHEASSWIIDLPFSDKRRIEQTIDFEVENYVPFDLDEVVLEYGLLPAEGDGARVLTVIVPNDRMSQRLALLQSCGADPTHLSVDALELCRLAPDVADTTHAIVDVGATRTLICVVRDGKPCWFRSFDHGAGSFPTEVRHADEGPQEVQGTPTAWFGHVRASLLAAEESGAPGIDGVLLTGGGAGWFALAEGLEEDLGVPVEPLPLPPSQVNSDVAPKPGPEHALAYGLALRAFVERKAFAVELRKGPFSFQAANRQAARLAMLAGAALLLLAVGYVGNHFWQMASLRAELDEANAALLGAINAQFPEVSGAQLIDPSRGGVIVAEKVQELEARSAALEGYELTALKALKEMSSTVPGTIKVDVDEFLVNDEMIRMRGTTVDFASVDGVEAAVLSNDKFRGAYKSDVSKAKSRDGEAEMRFTVTVPREVEEEVDG